MILTLRLSLRASIVWMRGLVLGARRFALNARTDRHCGIQRVQAVPLVFLPESLLTRQARSASFETLPGCARLFLSSCNIRRLWRFAPLRQFLVCCDHGDALRAGRMPENRAGRNSTRWPSAFRKIDPEFPDSSRKIMPGRRGGLCRSIRRFFYGSGSSAKSAD